MIIRKSDARTFDIPHCHGGEGTLQCTEYLGDYERKERGFMFLHDDTLPPGASVGEHPHTRDEEIYFILEGEGTMVVDGTHSPVHAGDSCLVRAGQTHGLVNSGSVPIRFLVVGAKP